MARLNANQIENAKAWMYDIFSLNNLNTSGSTVRPSWYYDNQWRYRKNSAVAIWDAIKVRKVDYHTFEAIDRTLNDLADVSFIASLDPNAQRGRLSKKKAEMLASYIAYFCASKNIYWDDTLMTPYERDALIKTTIGAALWEYNCFVTQEDPKAKAARASTSTSTRTSAPRTPGQAPQNGYKSLGGLSDKVPNLVGTPGQKHTFASGTIMYCIEADKLGKNTPSIFITPVSNSGQAVSDARAKSVNIGSGNGYSDCKLWWDNLSEATNFLTQCQNKFSSSRFQNLHIAKARADSNGYFKVVTEFGVAYIKAGRLNEEILEYLVADESLDTETVKTNEAYSIQDIDTYSEAFDKYRD